MSAKMTKKYVLYMASVCFLSLEPHSSAYAGGGFSKSVINDSSEIVCKWISPKLNSKIFRRHNSTYSNLKFDNLKKQHYYNIEPNKNLNYSIKLAESGKSISKEEIGNYNITQRIKIEEKKESNDLSSYKMPKYETIKKK